MAETETLKSLQEETLAQEEQVEKKSKWMYPALITVLIVFFVVIFAYGLRLVTTMEHPHPPVTLTEGKTPAPKTAQQAADYLNAVVAKAVAEKPKLASSRDTDLDKDSVATDGGAYAEKTLRFLADAAEERISDGYAGVASDFGEGLQGLLPEPALTAADIEDFRVDYAHYYCVVCGAVSDEATPGCESCHFDYPPQERYADDYSVTLTLKNDPALLERLFGPSVEDSAAALGEAVKEYAELTDLSYTCEGLTVFFRADRMTDELREIRFTKNINAAATAEFTGVYADLQPIGCSASFTDTVSYSLTFPEIVLNKHEISVQPGKRDELVANRVQADPECEVKWTSSDESVVTVDDKGFIKAGKTTGTATVTASMEFMGKTYSDSCEVVVKIPVEYMRINRHNLKLSVGESETLKARVASDQKGFAFRKPTVSTVTWHSTNEAVAAVDENGAVTALAPGEAVVYALTDDGYYRSSCTVRVTGNEPERSGNDG